MQKENNRIGKANLNKIRYNKRFEIHITKLTKIKNAKGTSARLKLHNKG